MTDRVVAHRPEKFGQVAHLKMPDTVGLQDGSYLSHELQRILEIVKHRDRSHDAGTFISKTFAKQTGREKLRDADHIFGIIAAKLFRSRIDSYAPQTITRIKGEQSAVIAADVQHQVARSSGILLEQPGNFCLQMVDHRPIERRAVAVVLAIHLVEIV